jgi:hypothetical protein
VPSNCQEEKRNKLKNHGRKNEKRVPGIHYSFSLFFDTSILTWSPFFLPTMFFGLSLSLLSAGN